jgi:hopanoid biosynthesis associated RND transporter like protein HpnN
MIARLIARIVGFSNRHAWPVIVGCLLAAVASSLYLARNFAIDTDSSKLLSASLPWRQQEMMINRAFPERTDLILAVIKATTPEAAQMAARALTDRLATRPDLFKSVRWPEGEPFFARNGILFESKEAISRDTAELIKAQAFLGSLAADPSLRGIMATLSQAMQGVRLKQASLADLERPMALIADALTPSSIAANLAFSWRSLLSQRAPEPSELRRILLLRPVLDFTSLQPGGKATDFIRASVQALGLTLDRGVSVRLTGPIPLADEEFGTIAEGAGVNGAVTIAVVVVLLWLALRKPRIILSVLINLFVGLVITAAVGLMMVGALNLISVAFAVLFIGLGVDFGIQFSVRYRSERHQADSIPLALRNAALGVGGPLLLATASTAAGFYSFLPTAYRGLSELGLIAGTGMFVAFTTTITLLPALLSVLKPGGETGEIGYAMLAPLDHFLERWRYWIIGATLTATLAASPLLYRLHFDFNPMDLRSAKTESVSTLLELAKDPQTSPNTIDVLAPDLAQADALAQKIAAVPQVAQTMTLQSFVPEDQDAKLAIIQDASFFLEPTLDPSSVKPAPSDAEDAEAIGRAAKDLTDAAATEDSRAAHDAKRLGHILAGLARAAPDERQKVRDVLLPPLVATLDQVRDLLRAQRVTIDNLPQDVVRDWIAADGRARIEVAPKGDSNDNATLRRFANAVQAVAPDAVGAPIFIIQAAKTVVRAFWQAGLWSITSIAILLILVLRRLTDVLLTLIPLLVAIIVTLEICVVINLQLNFANIIALPLLLGIGVAFKIYYMMAWRAGGHNFLQSSLTRAVLFSALATGTAFGSLWLSHHPGTSSMGKLMALALVTTLAAALLFQPALLATRKHEER